MDFDDMYMHTALREAQAAGEAGEVPVGAVIVHPKAGIVGKARNQVETLKDATAHAEILALTQASAALGDWRLEHCTLYVTKEPCPMCAGALVFSRIKKVVWGVTDPLRGGESHFGILQSPALHHRVDLEPGRMAQECRDLFVGFFRNVRENQIPKP